VFWIGKAVIVPDFNERLGWQVALGHDFLSNHAPYRAWANFEFQTADGAIYEVDLLVLTKQGFWLVEIKSWPGKVRGDVATWTRTHDGKTITEDKRMVAI
jgi:Nuclease-related domain